MCNCELCQIINGHTKSPVELFMLLRKELERRLINDEVKKVAPSCVFYPTFSARNQGTVKLIGVDWAAGTPESEVQMKEYPHETIAKQQKQIDRKEGVIVKQQEELQQLKRNHYYDMSKMQAENHILKDKLAAAEQAFINERRENEKLKTDLQRALQRAEAAENLMISLAQRIPPAK